jgi:hypothetical protein
VADKVRGQFGRRRLALPAMAAPPTLSVVIEFENAGRIGCDRAGHMLAQLHRQLAGLPEGLIDEAEILFVHRPGQVDEAWLRGAAESLGRWPGKLRYLPSSAAGYYEQKNEGAARAAGDIILFVDSDVVPEDGWLEALIEPLATGAAGIVAGATSVERRGLYSTAMALGWIFPMPPPDQSLRRAPLFYANNVAFRRELIEAMRFPEADQYRVQVGAVHRALAERGHPIWMSGRAAVLHPPPEGVAGFVTRALWCGYDSSTLLPRAKAPLAFAAEAVRALRRVARDRRRAGLGAAATVGALGVIGAYHAIRLLGFAGGLLAPRATWRQLKRIAP